MKKTIFIFLFYLFYFLAKAMRLFFSIKTFRKQHKNSILFLENFPVENAGYQYRAAKWAELFKNDGYKAEVVTILESKQRFENLLQKKTIEKFLIISIIKRFKHCIYSLKFQIVIVRRELLLFNDYGNLFMEKLLTAIHPNVILDFDDNIAASKKESRIISRFGKLMKENPAKFTETLKMYKNFIVGSKYLKDMVLSINKNITENNVCIIPSCVDYNKYEPKQYDTEKLKKEIVFGWIGGNHNLHNIDILIEPLNKIATNGNIKLIVVSGKDYINKDAKFTVENQRWTLDAEVEQIKQFDIGLMPFYDNLAGRGKCGFKLIQYMGLGVVGIATNITINSEIIKNEEIGFLVDPNNSNWEITLYTVIGQIEQFPDIGKNACNTIFKNYTFKSNKTLYLNFINGRS